MAEAFAGIRFPPLENQAPEPSDVRVAMEGVFQAFDDVVGAAAPPLTRPWPVPRPQAHLLAHREGARRDFAEEVLHPRLHRRVVDGLDYLPYFLAVLLIG